MRRMRCDGGNARCTKEDRAVILERGFMESHVRLYGRKMLLRVGGKREERRSFAPIYDPPAPRYASAEIANDAMIWRAKQAEEIAS